MGPHAQRFRPAGLIERLGSENPTAAREIEPGSEDLEANSLPTAPTIPPNIHLKIPSLTI